MKTFLTYLTFAALLTLCYIEKINAEAAKSLARRRAARNSAQIHTSVRAEMQVAMVQFRE
ncbi:hypothetical protein [Dyadobacter soli]|nr:hypothetical protein [Dyadobacter soli]